MSSQGELVFKKSRDNILFEKEFKNLTLQIPKTQSTENLAIEVVNLISNLLFLNKYLFMFIFLIFILLVLDMSIEWHFDQCFPC